MHHKLNATMHIAGPDIKCENKLEPAIVILQFIAPFLTVHLLLTKFNKIIACKPVFDLLSVFACYPIFGILFTAFAICL